jgi:proliferating cell nuclear antigen
MYLGINLNHFYKMLKSIKKKDSIILFIEDKNRNNLGIQVIPKEKDRVSTSYITIQSIQNLDIDTPTGYGKPIIVSSAEYQKMCKDMNNIGSTISIETCGSQIKFSCDASNVYSREVTFGTNNENVKTIDYSVNFETEKLARITKIAGLHTTMKIFPKKGLPLLFKSSVGSLGDIFIYIKSKDQIDNESVNPDDDE